MAGFGSPVQPKCAHRLLKADKTEQQDADDDFGPPGAEGAVEGDVALDQALDQHAEQRAQHGADAPVNSVPPITTAAMASNSTPLAASA